MPPSTPRTPRRATVHGTRVVQPRPSPKTPGLTTVGRSFREPVSPAPPVRPPLLVSTEFRSPHAGTFIDRIDISPIDTARHNTSPSISPRISPTTSLAHQQSPRRVPLAAGPDVDLTHKPRKRRPKRRNADFSVSGSQVSFSSSSIGDSGQQPYGRALTLQAPKEHFFLFCYDSFANPNLFRQIFTDVPEGRAAYLPEYIVQFMKVPQTLAVGCLPTLLRKRHHSGVEGVVYLLPNVYKTEIARMMVAQHYRPDAVTVLVSASDLPDAILCDRVQAVTFIARKDWLMPDHLRSLHTWRALFSPFRRKAIAEANKRFSGCMSLLGDMLARPLQQGELPAPVHEGTLEAMLASPLLSPSYKISIIRRAGVIPEGCVPPSPSMMQVRYRTALFDVSTPELDTLTEVDEHHLGAFIKACRMFRRTSPEFPDLPDSPRRRTVRRQSSAQI